MNDRLLKWRRYGLSSLALTVILWGCTVTPTQKLNVKDMSKPFEEGTIISARMGAPVSLQDLLKDLEDSRITYVGEKHTNTEHHRIQLQIIEAVFKNNPNLVVGMEMFDHTYQDVLDLWSKGELAQKDFLRKSHWYANWRYDYSLYRDILDFIKEHNIRAGGS